MFKRALSFFLYILLTLSIILLFAYKNNPGVNLYVKKVLGVAPCQKPLTYSIGQIDQGFGVTKQDLINITAEAEKIWDSSSGKKLFQYSQKGKVKINLIYDERQLVTDKRKEIDQTIENQKTSYETLKNQYSNLKTEYQSELAEFNTRVANFNQRQKVLNQEITSWNAKGGAPKTIYQNLETERKDLITIGENLKNYQTRLSNLVAELNTLITEINQKAKEVNAGIETYNQIAENIGREFDEGIYREDETGASINIYQFSNRTQLIRVLAHEFGHALGLGHVDEKSALMYKANDSEELALKSADISILKELCHI